jgi:hypothetical protein
MLRPNTPRIKAKQQQLVSKNARKGVHLLFAVRNWGVPGRR